MCKAHVNASSLQTPFLHPNNSNNILQPLTPFSVHLFNNAAGSQEPKSSSQEPASAKHITGPPSTHASRCIHPGARGQWMSRDEGHMSYELRVTSNELPVASCQLQVTCHETCDLRAVSYESLWGRSGARRGGETGHWTLGAGRWTLHFAFWAVRGRRNWDTSQCECPPNVTCFFSLVASCRRHIWPPPSRRVYVPWPSSGKDNVN